MRNLTARSSRGRRGSILILVVALLVLLALIGTAYLSSTQTERQTAGQATVNVEVGLQLDTLTAAVDQAVVAGLYGTNPAGRVQNYNPNVYTPNPVTSPNQYAGQPLLRYPGQQSDTPAAGLVGLPPTYYPTQVSAYRPYTCAQTDAFLGDRVPAQVNLTATLTTPGWKSISWPPFPDAAGNYVFENPFEAAVNLGPATNRPSLQFIPTAKSVDGRISPGMVVNVFPPTPTSPATPPIPVGLPVTGVVGPGNVIYGSGVIPVAPALPPPNVVVVAASASGDGIADSLLFKMPGGPVDGVTYYAAIRVFDNNSAVNASSAWSADPANGTGVNPLTQLAVTAQTETTSGDPVTYGFFKADVDLANMLNPNPVAPPGYAGVVPPPQAELYMLNRYRFGGLAPSAGFPAGVIDMRSVLNLDPGTGTTPSRPVDDLVNPTGAQFGTYQYRGDFTWYSSSEALDVLLTERPGNPGVPSLPLSGGTLPPRMKWLGWDEAANLAYKFTLHNPAVPASPLETALYNELYANARTTPFGAGDAGTWFASQFKYQPSTVYPSGTLRPILTAANPVSNATPSRFTSPTGQPGSPWVAGVQYQFGDWVTGRDGRAYVCTLPHRSSNLGVDNDPVSINWTPGDPDRWYAANSAGIGLWAGVRVADPGGNLGHGMTFGTDPSRTGLPFTQIPVKVSINTGDFGQLWLGFCQVMADSVGIPPFSVPATTNLPQWLPPMQPDTTVPLLAAGSEPQMPIWRSVIRPMDGAVAGPVAATVVDDTTVTVGANPITRLSPAQMLKLRAALAAVNAMGLRGAAADVTSRRIMLNKADGTPAYDVEVFGGQVQPFIGAVYAHVDPTDPVHNNFVAIQLLNPYDVAITVDPAAGWKFGVVDRVNAAGPGANRLTMTDLGATSGPFTKFTIPAKTAAGPGVIVLESNTNKPVGVTDQGFGQPPPVQVPGLETTIGRYELFLMRPRVFGTTSASAVPSVRLAAGPYDEGYDEHNVYDLVPTDQIDLTNVPATTGQTGPFDFYYRRGSDPAAHDGWNFVYPGNLTTTAFQYAPFINGDPAVPPNADLTLYGSGAAAQTPATVSGSPTSPTYATLPLVWANTFMAGPNRLFGPPSATVQNSPPLQPTSLVNTYPVNRFPYGGFARNGDMLQVPFIGSYRIRGYSASNPSPPNQFYEMNSVTADSALADDTTLPGSGTPPAGIPRPTPTDGADLVMREQLGRFCPVGDLTGANTNLATLADFGPPTDPAVGTSPYWHYHWAGRLFDYFDVRPNADDYYPNVDPAQTDMTVTPNVQPKYYAASASPTVVPHPVPNLNPTVANNITAGLSEDAVGTEGLVNINTASAEVLAALPWTPTRSTNYDIASQIVQDRNKNGPFRSIMDLYRVPYLIQQTDTLINTTATPDPYQFPKLGVFSPGGIINFDKVDAPVGTPPTLPTDDMAGYDFQKRFVLLNRVSNLITTRSDTFTCYLLVQGWRGVGTSTPTLVVERRKAFFVDRNAITATNNRPAHHPIPTE